MSNISAESSRTLSKLYMELKDITTKMEKDIEFIKVELSEIKVCMADYGKRMTKVEVYVNRAIGALVILSIMMTGFILPLMVNLIKGMIK
jgi:hypothetical protein